jgi:hypothetical protein
MPLLTANRDRMRFADVWPVSTTMAPVITAMSRD